MSTIMYYSGSLYFNFNLLSVNETVYTGNNIDRRKQAKTIAAKHKPEK